MKLPAIELGIWSWGSGMAGGDQEFGNHTNAERPDNKGSWENPMA